MVVWICVMFCVLCVVQSNNIFSEISLSQWLCVYVLSFVWCVLCSRVTFLFELSLRQWLCVFVLCFAWHCVTLHSIALHCSAMLCIALPCSAVHCIALDANSRAEYRVCGLFKSKVLICRSLSCLTFKSWDANMWTELKNVVLEINVRKIAFGKFIEPCLIPSNSM